MPTSLLQVQVSPSNDERELRAMRARRLVRTVAWSGAALTLCVLVLAAAMRLQAAGLGCEPWPTCYGAGIVRVVEPPAWTRLAHRVAAMLVALCAVTVAVLCFSARGGPRLPKIRPLVVVGGVAALAGLGRFSGPTAPSAVALANLLLGLTVTLAFASLATSPQPGRRLSTADRFTAVALAATVVLGGVASTYRLAAGCTGLLGCTADAPTAAALGWIVGSHRIVGVAAVLWTCAWAAASYRRGAARGWVLVLIASCLAAAAFGFVQAAGIAALPAALMHHALGGVALVAAVACTVRKDPPRWAAAVEQRQRTRTHRGRSLP
jgi:heme a synthase